ncbi:MAG TPA: type II toxin-antitoxin system death-on-curing family toxin [Rhizomicrobium sp.]|nr:type II toxin-antitoxin system death-on-curing family toxin [Rhizomicrobium sp.]
MSDWIWIEKDIVLAIHDEQIFEHGGASGVRDNGALESALARPQNLSAYGDPDAASLAASCAFGIAKNHPFVDGNKRTAFVALELFLDLNGYVLEADDAQCVLVMLSVASSAFSEAELAKWIRARVKRMR